MCLRISSYRAVTTRKATLGCPDSSRTRGAQRGAPCAGEIGALPAWAPRLERDRDASTDEMRMAFQRYRDFFDRLLNV
jgi:hypothetical protein